MSTTYQAGPPAAAFMAEQFHRILGCLTLAAFEDRSVLFVLGLRAVQDAAARKSRVKPALRLDKSLATSIEASGVIYPLRHAGVGNHYYIHYLRERRTLLLKYQQILGSRLLMARTQAQQFEDAVLRLRQPEQAIAAGASGQEAWGLS